MKLSEKLIKRSHILNQKRNEIVEVHKILCGLLVARARLDAEYEFMCSDGYYYYWNVTQVMGKKGATVSIKFMRTVDGNEECLLQTPSDETCGKQCQMKDVELIHENLDILIAGIDERYPEMLQPLLHAEE
jgi:hypothetical protein